MKFMLNNQDIKDFYEERIAIMAESSDGRSYIQLHRDAMHDTALRLNLDLEAVSRALG